VAEEVPQGLEGWRVMVKEVSKRGAKHVTE